MNRNQLYRIMRNNLGLKLLALLVAVFLWIYVTMVADSHRRPREPGQSMLRVPNRPPSD